MTVIPALLIAYGISGLALLSLLKSNVLVALRAYSAPPNAYRIAFLATGVWIGLAAGAITGVLPWWAPLPEGVLPLAVGFLPWQLTELAGGRTDKEGLRHAYYKVMDTANRSDLTKPEFDRLLRAIQGLDRYRNPATTEFIVLTQQELMDWAHGRDVNPADAKARDLRIRKLGNDLWLDPADPRVRDGRPGPS